MTAREDAIEAIARALHSDNCPDDVDRGEPCGCVDWDREAEVAYEAAEPIIRADERERMAGLARRVQGGGIRDYEAEVRERLREAWREEGHAVLFNRAGDDLTPTQRVGKWLGGESE